MDDFSKSELLLRLDRFLMYLLVGPLCVCVRVRLSLIEQRFVSLIIETIIVNIDLPPIMDLMNNGRNI